MKQFNLVSSPFASGVTWLVNALLELGVKTTHVSAKHPQPWKAVGNGSAVTLEKEVRDHLRWHLPSLTDDRSFVFDPHVEVFWEHRLDLARHLDRPTIVFVRDPRDAIHSLFARQQGESASYTDYLGRRDTWPDHFPGLFDLPPAETWAAWHTFWRGVSEVVPTLFIRFEAMRATPEAHLQQILEFIGIRRPAAQIRRALKASTFDRARAAMERVAQETGREFLTARRGEANEWRKRSTEEIARFFEGPAAGVMQQLGYDLAGLNSPATGSLTEPTLSPESIAAMAAADEAYRCADLPRFWSDWQNAWQGATSSEARQWVANAGVALDWVQSIFGPELASSASGQAAYDAFVAFQRRFGNHASIEQAQLRRLADMESVSLDSVLSADGRSAPFVLAEEPVLQPRLVEANVNGFNLVRFGRKVYALSQAIGPFDLTTATPEELKVHEQAGRCYICDSVATARRLTARPSPVPGSAFTLSPAELAEDQPPRSTRGTQPLNFAPSIPPNRQPTRP